MVQFKYSQVSPNNSKTLILIYVEKTPKKEQITHLQKKKMLNTRNHIWSNFSPFSFLKFRLSAHTCLAVKQSVLAVQVYILWSLLY